VEFCSCPVTVNQLLLWDLFVNVSHGCSQFRDCFATMSRTVRLGDFSPKKFQSPLGGHPHATCKTKERLRFHWIDVIGMIQLFGRFQRDVHVLDKFRRNITRTNQ